MAEVEGPMAVSLAVCEGPRQVRVLSLTLPARASVAQALEAGGVPAGPGLRVGVWGRLAPLQQALRPGDRVEVYRDLVADPKESRRLRYRAQHARPSRRLTGR